MRIIRELIKFQPIHKKTNINQALTFLNNILNKKSIVFILSDFFDENYQKSLTILSIKHDVVALRLYDDFEEKVKNIGFSLFYDLESNTKYWLDTSSKNVLSEIEKNYNKYTAYFKNSFLKTGASFVDLDCNENYINKLLTFLKAGEKKYNLFFYFVFVLTVFCQLINADNNKKNYIIDDIKLGEIDTLKISFSNLSNINQINWDDLNLFLKIKI